MRPSPSIIRYYFNSRPHGGRPPPLPFQRAIGHFNSRPHGGRRCPRTVQVGRFKFQLTPSRRATTRTILPATPRLHFNSRPHGGRPLLTIVFVCSGISTHALTEGDFILKYQDNIRFLFQLTPSRRATLISSPSFSPFSYFNSRPHGGRPSVLVKKNSIPYFNSRPHGGRRQI